MTTALNLLITMAIWVGVVACFVIIYALVWYGIFIPIRKKDEYEKELQDKRHELEQIQIQKGLEWESYKALQDQLDATRKEYFSNKKKLDEIKEENAKLEIDKMKLKETLTVLKKEKS